MQEIGTIAYEDGKAVTVTAEHPPKILTYQKDGKYYYRPLTVRECERLQTMRDGYTDGVSKTQAYKMLGNGWTRDVIVHILSFLEVEK